MTIKKKVLVDKNIPQSPIQELLHLYLNNPYEAIIIVDDDGKIVFLSQSLEQSDSISIEDAIGKDIKEIFPKEVLTNVLTTGRAEIGQTDLFDGTPFVTSRIPLKKGGRVIGAVTKVVFWHAQNLNDLYRKINGLKRKVKRYEQEFEKIYRSRYGFDNILGDSSLIQRAKDIARTAAETDTPVLLIGESGTGKELFAHAIHRASQRKEGPFVRINCAAIPEELIEAELFGYAPGSFTGGNRKGKIGKFEKANGGTIFLDEIGDMSLNMQTKLLRVLEEKEIEKIGGAPKRIDFRSIFATNSDLEKMIAEKRFRLDLYYRINVVKIDLPPLRNMTQDLELHANNFLNEMKREMPKKVDAISEEGIKALEKYSWPGNIRELRNVIERALITSVGPRIELSDLPQKIILNSEASSVPKNGSLLLKDRLAIAEKEIIMDTFRRFGENRSEAARILGIHRTGLHKKMKKYGLS